MAAAGEEDNARRPERASEWARPRDAIPNPFAKPADPMPPDAMLFDENRRDTGPTVTREMPELLVGDIWGRGQSTADTYEGRHHTKNRASRLAIAIAIVVVGLTAAIGLPFALTSPPDPDDQQAFQPTGLPGDPTSTEAGQALSTYFSPQPTPTPTPTPAASGTASALPPAPPPVPTTARPPTTTAAPKPPFPAVTYEAEAGGSRTSVGGSARSTTYPNASGGRVVRNIGNWGMSGGPGVLQLNGLAIPSTGTYALTLYFVHLDNQANRTAVITVSGSPSVTATFTGSSNCCASKTITIVIAAGTHTVTIANSTGRAPSIDRVVITRP